MLGEYEFNPFVDVELDYDENMEEGNHMDESHEGNQANSDRGEIVIVVRFVVVVVLLFCFGGFVLVFYGHVCVVFGCC